MKKRWTMLTFKCRQHFFFFFFFGWRPTFCRLRLRKWFSNTLHQRLFILRQLKKKKKKKEGQCEDMSPLNLNIYIDDVIKQTLTYLFVSTSE